MFYRMSGYNCLSYVGQSDRKIEAQLASMKLHIGYLRSLEDSERSRAACVQYLQNWLPTFYPNRPDLVKEAQQLAGSLGGRLEIPRFSRKYAWIQKTFGLKTARRAQVILPRVKWSLIRSLDKALFRLNEQKTSDQRRT